MNYQKVIEIAKLAGEKIVEIYNSDFAIYQKSDMSPLTEADVAAHNTITSELKKLHPVIPIISEEGNQIDWTERRSWDEYWLVDPLDGTKEFLNRNGEFTVNIAHIQNGKPVWGVVYVPVSKVLYFGGAKTGSSKISDGILHKIQVSAMKSNNREWILVGSRSHNSKEFVKFANKFEQPEIISMGSSLKICMVAEGLADLYPRFGLTSEWDTAAAHAILQGAGGILIEINSSLPVEYNKKNSLLNPFFIAANGASKIWAE